MTDMKLKDLSLLAVLVALAVALGRVGQIPTPTGFLTLVDAVIYFSAFYLGAKKGAVVGGLSAFLLDLLSGYPNWMLISLVAHGAQGYFAGWTGRKQVFGLTLASLAMVGTYFLAGMMFYGLGEALAGILGNLLQNFFGLAVGFLIDRLARRHFKR